MKFSSWPFANRASGWDDAAAKTKISDTPSTEHKDAHSFAFGLVKLPGTTFCGLRAKYVCGTVQPCCVSPARTAAGTAANEEGSSRDTGAASAMHDVANAMLANKAGKRRIFCNLTLAFSRGRRPSAGTTGYASCLCSTRNSATRLFVCFSIGSSSGLSSA
jgi:hypothetical protein